MAGTVLRVMATVDTTMNSIEMMDTILAAKDVSGFSSKFHKNS